MDGAPKLAGNTWPGGAPGAVSIIPVGVGFGRVSQLIAARPEKQSRNLPFQSTWLNGTVPDPTDPEPSSRVSTRISVELGSIVSRRCNTNPVLESDSYSC